ncbi:MAG: hypothetical protein P4L85_14255 [Paludisphaera borealis]|uniref:hypothetical protein n=1 Tax=Paludisphaera borealis TaxID=1387353 RepID=UPI00284A5F9B|nr:hypothetical protein [Paludisphaera borealis]MDR3620509.1 hypothetical protein [Paludisphaera borealis]
MGKLTKCPEGWSLIPKVVILGLIAGCGSNEVPLIIETMPVETVPEFDQPRFDKLVAEHSVLVAKLRGHEAELDEAMREKIKARHPDWPQDKLETQLEFLEWKHDSSNVSGLEDYIESLQRFGSRLALRNKTTGTAYPSELTREDYSDRYNRWNATDDPEIAIMRMRRNKLEDEIRKMKFDYVFP